MQNVNVNEYTFRDKHDKVLSKIMQVAVVPNVRSMNKLPKIEGLLSYRSDDDKLYLKEKAQWRALATQKQVSLIEIK